jgi:hypothetical protein
LGPNRSCTVDGAKSPNQISAGSSLLKDSNFPIRPHTSVRQYRSPVNVCMKLPCSLMSAYLAVRTGFASH